MSVYVDPIFEAKAKGISNTKWCHMVADTEAELHAMAHKLKLKREWFQDKNGRPHYDLYPTKRAKAIELGAIEIQAKATPFIAMKTIRDLL